MQHHQTRPSDQRHDSEAQRQPEHETVDCARVTGVASALAGRFELGDRREQDQSRYTYQEGSSSRMQLVLGLRHQLTMEVMVRVCSVSLKGGRQSVLSVYLF